MQVTENTIDLTDREHGELVGALQIARDKLRADGLTGDGVQGVIEKVYAVTQPGTAGLRLTELVSGDQAPMRYALVSANAGQTDQIAAYMPGNYAVLGRTPIGASNTVQVLIGGRDASGWTLDGYVLPRLASGMYYGTEIGA